MNTLVKKVSLLNVEHGTVEETNIGIAEDVISFVGSIPDGFRADKVIEGKGKLAMPGFVNSHTHVAMTLFRNYGDDLPLWNWLNEKIWPAEARLTRENVYWGAMLGIAEMIKFGVTSFADMYFFIDEIGKALRDSKMRGAVSRGLIGNADFDRSQLKENEDFIKNWHNEENGRIKGMVAPHAPYTCTPEYIMESIELARKYGVAIHTHLSESDKEVADSLRQYGMTPVAHMEKLGMFEGPTLAAHCVKLTDEDLDIFYRKRVNVLNNPTSNLKLGNGFARVKEIYEKGINISLGTDGCASNNNLNLLEEVNLAALINKGVTGDPTCISALEALKMGTLNGAKSLGLEDCIGDIEAGKKADLILIDMDNPHMTPRNNLASSIVYSLQSEDINTTIVDGNILMENRELKTIDIERVKHMVQSMAEKII